MARFLVVFGVPILLTAAVIGVSAVAFTAHFPWLAGAAGLSGLVAVAAGALQEVARGGSAQKALAGFLVAAFLRALVVLGVMIVTLQFSRDATIAATLAAAFIGVGSSITEAIFAAKQLAVEQSTRSTLAVNEGEASGE